jgi:hypothetical protein
MGSIEAGWERLCETAWELGLTELRLTPTPPYRDECPTLHSFAPPVQGPPAFPDGGHLSVAAWSIDVEVGGEAVAEVVGRRPLTRMDFDPERFAGLVRGLVRRHLEASPGDRSRLEDHGAS